MLATAWPNPFDDDRWVFELKWDGVRCLLTSSRGRVRLESRAGNDMTHRYPEISGPAIPDDVVIDGEIVALDPAGRPSFELLQGRMHNTPTAEATSSTAVTYVVFDLLHSGESLLQAPLEERADQLSELVLPPQFVVADRFHGASGPIWRFVQENDLEGIVAKRLGSRYVPGTRSPDWRKIGHFKQLRAVVGGFTSGTGGRAGTFGSLLLGLWDGSQLRWIGAVGSGFDDRSLVAIRGALDEMTAETSPFHPDTGLPSACTWVQPQLVAMVRYKQWTAAGKVRAPSFKGFTDDAVEAVTWSAEGPSVERP
jgi:bifunctional non-homologous end joining protein LigD